MTIKEKIKQLEAALVACSASVLHYLNPGLPTAQILEVLSANNINPYPGLIALYEWHNGTPYFRQGISSVFLNVLPYCFFYSLQDMVRLKREFLSWKYLAANLGDMNDYWPLLGSLEDDMYLLKNSTGEIYYISPAVQIYGNLEFTSIDKMLDFAIECYQQNIFVIDPKRGLRTDFDKYEVLRSKYLNNSVRQ
ncbi:hypothetical protein [Niastella sp. OAS944]|uniref:hypothetical protein n=1 Tax=Niastella sp. OAS944 TaxID=2664089 RepID=UPI0034710869|nr:hypothetical protein [Chitinophagaceae bacterium OAS944]